MYENTSIMCYVYDIVYLVQFWYVVLVEGIQTENICVVLVFTLL